MSTIEKNISQFIKTQFPSVYREEGELFVEFVTNYYEWMEESNNVLYHARRLSDYSDIDMTVDDYVLNFKKKYLDGIQFDTAAQTKNLVKHSLDLYRSKGTERSVDLFFRAVFGAPAEVYYPGEDIFRLSDGKWVRPRYLEITNSDYNIEFVGKIIQGVNSKATAFVERYIRRKIKSKFIHIFYISAITGEFETGELITLIGSSLKNTPTIIGSMTTLQVITGGINFEVGDIVNLTSNNGLQGKARVSSISNLTGAVSYDLTDSGWGYSTNSDVIISEKVLFLSNVVAGSNTTDFSFEIFETIKQPLANISLINANATLNLVNNAVLSTYYSNGVVAGRGRVLNYTSNGSTNGEVYVSEFVNTLGPVLEPAANLAGTVSVSTVDTPILGTSTTTQNNTKVIGVSTSYTSDLVAGQAIKMFAYNSNNVLTDTQENIVQSIANTTEMTLATNANFTSSNVIIQSLGTKTIVGTGTALSSNFVYGDEVAFFTNSTNYVIRTVNSVVNATFMTIQEPIGFSNVSAKCATVTTNNKIYTSGNVINANISSRTDKSATANVMGVSTRNTLKLVNCSSSFSNTDYIYQLNADNDEIANSRIQSVVVTGSNATVVTANTIGVFVVNGAQPIRTRHANGVVSGKTANLAQLDLEIGVISISNTFVTTENNFVYGVNSFSNATLVRVGSGSLANFSVSNTFTFPESITITSDKVQPYLTVKLNVPAYGFPKFPSANLSTQYLKDIFSNTTLTIGGISSLTDINPGKNYDYAPFVTVYDPLISSFDMHDFEMQVSNVAGGFFTVGEVVYQNVGGTGIVKSSNSSHISVKRITFENTFDLSSALIGRASGVTANIDSISEIKNILQIGLNAVVQTNVQTASGSVNTLEIIDAGFGYIQDETATFTSEDGIRSGTAKINLGRRGISEGFYRNRNGQLSADKKIFDGEYYQDFSYEIRSPIRVDKYSEMLKNILHVSGTKMFSATVLSEVANTSLNIISDITTE
jgi:hypothetical protein